MNNIARELVRLAREMVSVSNFTVLKPLKLVREGATRDSIMNARLLRYARYELVNGDMTYDNVAGSWEVKAYFFREIDHADGVHIFKGFSFGYGGEGPRGLHEFLKMFNWGADPKKIMSKSWDTSLPERGVINLKAFA